MLKTNDYARQLMTTPGVRRNFRVIFPDGERGDLTSSDVVDDTVRMTESVCSETVFRFGCCERSMIEFEAVGIENILGCRIRCGIEYDTSGLSDWVISQIQNDIAGGQCDGELVLEADSDLGWGFWRMPYGEYWVTSCPRDHAQRSHRAVTAYTADPTVLSEVERVRLNTYIPGHSSFSAGMLALAAANIGYQLPGVFNAWGWQDLTGTNSDYKTWAQIQALGASETKTFSVTSGGHTHAVRISGTYAVVDDFRSVFLSDPAAGVPASVRLSGWDTDEAWAYYQSIFAAAGVAEPTVPAHTRLPRTYLQPHIGQDKLDQYGPYDHAPIYWLPDEGCPFFIQQCANQSLNASTFTRIMWDVTVLYYLDDVLQSSRTFFPLSSLSARVGLLYIPNTVINDVDLNFESSNSYTSNNVEQYVFTGAYEPVDILSQYLEVNARDVKVDRHGVPWLKHLRDVTQGGLPTDVLADNVEELFWDDAGISPIGQVQYQKRRWNGEEFETVWDVDYASGGGGSVYSMPSNIVILQDGTAVGSYYARKFLTLIPSKPIIPFESVIHEQAWLEPGDYVNVLTSDPDTPTLRICILTQTIIGVQDLRQEIAASGGTVFFEGNAFGQDVTMIFGRASGGGAAGAVQSSSGGGGGGGGGAGETQTASFTTQSGSPRYASITAEWTEQGDIVCLTFKVTPNAATQGTGQRMTGYLPSQIPLPRSTAILSGFNNHIGELDTDGYFMVEALVIQINANSMQTLTTTYIKQ